MTTPTSRLAYQDCFDFMDRVLGSPKGLRAKFNDYGEAWSFRLRCHAARQIDRQDNKKNFTGPNPEDGIDGHPLWGRSVYDDLKFKLKYDPDDRKKGFLDVVILSKLSYDIEELGEPVDEPPTPELAVAGVSAIRRRV